MSLYEYLSINAKRLLDYWDKDLNLIDIRELPHDYPDIIYWKCEKGHTWTLTVEKALKSKHMFCKQCYWDEIRKTKERYIARNKNTLNTQLQRYLKNH